jgi:hypothetical protein
LQLIELLFWGVLLHFVGDYLLQSNWMASEKLKRWWPAFLHALSYTLPFLLLTQNILALLIIGGTHAVIDRYRLAKHIVFAKNFLAPRKYWPSWEDSKKTGYPNSTPIWLATWLMIIADNMIHIIINSVTLWNLRN